TLSKMLASSETGMKGVEELKEVLTGIDALGHKCDVEVDVSLARGLNYYTGTIIEVKAKDVEIGSITGGGRYDNLTGVFGMPGLSGVGISFGADRIYDVMNQLNLYPESVTQAVRVMFANFGQREALQSLKYIKSLREAGISAELYPDSAKMKKQMSYADSEKIPYVAIVGESELEEGMIMLKNMVDGGQEKVTIEKLIETVKG
ncbi:MAG: ATP phosphoribosyltransferase regulatory subunit, partial [Muribaculaceae bacterium]|nr:ATP phosphoribosyltransferase regulatory subunit [Muribaculaceae bacterium]